MSKRSNEDVQIESEPASKRIANQNENEINIIAEQKLQSARTALDRLDYKNSSNICTELIDSPSIDSKDLLILRSSVLERTGQVEESVQHAERALKLKESKKAHLRCTFAYLSKALHHLELAQQQPQEEEAPLTKENMEELGNEIKKSKAREVGNPFRRVSEDLFLQMVSWFDSRALVIFAATSKQLRSSIYGSTELFRTFKMTAKGKSITGGIKFFSSKCGNSIRSIDIGVKDNLDQESQELLQTAISPSSSILEQISISHQGDLCQLVIDVASPCPSLKILSSEMLGREEGLPHFNNQSLTLQPSWSPRLQHLIWNGGSESLVCDETLLKSLQSAKLVFVYGRQVPMSWVLRLLSTASSTLVKVDLPRTREPVVEQIPRMIDLPNLVHLRVGIAPRSSTSEGSLFKSLHAPKLRCLCMRAVTIKDLSFLSRDTHLDQFVAFGLGHANPALNSKATDEKEANLLVEVIKNWKELRLLDLRLDGTVLPSFYTHLFDLLIPLSQDLPNLCRLAVGSERSVATDTPISANELVSLVRSRLRTDISAGISALDYVEINVPLKIDNETLSWLEENVASLDIRHRMD